MLTFWYTLYFTFDFTVESVCSFQTTNELVFLTILDSVNPIYIVTGWNMQPKIAYPVTCTILPFLSLHWAHRQPMLFNSIIRVFWVPILDYT